MRVPNFDLLKRTKLFAHRCIRLSLSLRLPKSPLGNLIRVQLLRCSTSVAANYRAAHIAATRKSFSAKLSICAEEADESNFWIEMIGDEKMMSPELLQPLLKESVELTKIFVASRRTLNRGKENDRTKRS